VSGITNAAHSSTESGDVPLPPILKWAGGKRWLVPELQRYWQPHRRLVEPFCGGLAVALGLQPQRALLADANLHLINFYQQVQRGLSLPFQPRNEAEYYYQARERFNALIQEGRACTPEAAALFYYLNRTGYNGLCRFNRRGLFNVPFGRYRTIRYRKDFQEYRQVLRNWQFVCQDFETLEIEPDDFIYADPPYDVPFRQYSQHGFSWEDQVRLVEWLVQHPGPVALSNQATERIVALYEDAGFQIRFLQAPRRISCTGDRSPAREVLALRNMP